MRALGWVKEAEKMGHIIRSHNICKKRPRDVEVFIYERVIRYFRVQ